MHPVKVKSERALDRMARNMQHKARKMDLVLQNVRASLSTNKRKLAKLMKKSRKKAEERVQR